MQIARVVLFATLGVLFSLGRVPGPSDSSHHSPSRPTACAYEPSGPVTMFIDEEVTFGNVSGDTCITGLPVSISPSNGTVGFASGSGCAPASSTTNGNGLFKVRACSTGTVTVTAYTSPHTYQTITIVVIYDP